MSDHLDPKFRLLVLTSSFLTYLIYKQFEPTRPFVHAILLFGVPALLCIQFNAQLSLLQDFGIFISHWALVLIFTVLYRLSAFHPLAKYPGPPLAKITKFYITYHNVKGDVFTVIKELHQQYGSVVRIGPNELSFNRADAIQPIYVAKIMQKGPYYDSRQPDDTATQLDGMRDFAAHAARRKPWTKAMSPANLKAYDQTVIQKTHELIEELSQRQGQTVDISHWVNLYAFDFMGHLVFGREFGMLKAGKDTNGLIHVVEEGVFGAGVISQFPWCLPILKLIPGANKGLVTMQLMSAQFASDRTKAGSRTKDLYYFLTEDEVASQSGARPEELLADGMLAIIAGSDTTATMLSHLFYFMLRHPQCAERLRKELAATFPHDEDPINFARLGEMPYLNACINEALRLLPPALSGLQRSVDPRSDGAMVGPYFVPGGTQVSVHLTSLHRNPQEFSPLTNTFWPDRWLAQETYTLPGGEVISKDQVVTNRAAYIPFSTGPQNCAGKALALAEMRAVFAAVMQKFEVRKAKDYDLDDWEKKLIDVYITLRGPLPVVLTARQK